MLPSALAEWNIYWGLGAMLLGVVFTAWLEGRMDSVSRLHKAGLLLLMGVCIHNFPEGMALGSMLHASSAAGMALAVMIAVHCYPETLAITLPLKQSGMKAYRIVLTAFLLALPMGLGALTGAAVSSFSPRFVDACVCFAGGVMLYIACGEILPESKQIWHGRMPAIGAMIGFAAGVWLTNTL
jgi:ZIP family zinc transporter